MLLSVRQSGLIWSDAKAVGFGISSSSSQGELHRTAAPGDGWNPSSSRTCKTAQDSACPCCKEKLLCKEKENIRPRALIHLAGADQGSLWDSK